MKELLFEVTIDAPKERVWRVLWSDETFRLWAGVIDPGTYMVGDLTDGSEVQFISADNGYGVTSLVKKCIVNEFLHLQHSADTIDSGSQLRADQWTGGDETYTLSQNAGVTTLRATFDVPQELVAIMQASYTKAFACVKEIAERAP